MGGVRRRLSVEFSQPEDYDTISVRQDSDIFLSLSQNYSTGQKNYLLCDKLLPFSLNHAYINYFAGPLSDDFYDATDLSNPYSPRNMATPIIDYLSDSDDSFVSATQHLDTVSHTHCHAH